MRLRRSLVNHFFYQHLYGQLQWPKQFGVDMKQLHPMKAINARVNKELAKALYVKPSLLRRVGTGETIGYGLFCNINLQGSHQGIHVASYVCGRLS